MPESINLSLEGLELEADLLAHLAYVSFGLDLNGNIGLLDGFCAAIGQQIVGVKLVYHTKKREKK